MNYIVITVLVCMVIGLSIYADMLRHENKNNKELIKHYLKKSNHNGRDNRLPNASEESYD